MIVFFITESLFFKVIKLSYVINLVITYKKRKTHPHNLAILFSE